MARLPRLLVATLLAVALGSARAEDGRKVSSQKGADKGEGHLDVQDAVHTEHEDEEIEEDGEDDDDDEEEHREMEEEDEEDDEAKGGTSSASMIQKDLHEGETEHDDKHEERGWFAIPAIQGNDLRVMRAEWPRQWQNEFLNGTHVGAGASGQVAVYGVRCDEGRTKVAVKSGTDFKIFRLEYAAAQQLQSPYFIRYFDYHDYLPAPRVSATRRAHLLMEAADKSLDTLFDELVGDPRRQEHLVRLFEDVLAGLAEMHSKGFVHGDLSPSNVLLVCAGGNIRSCGAKLTDLGSACGLAGQRKCHYAGYKGGYRSPEINEALLRYGGGSDEVTKWFAHHIDGRTDSFAAGSILYDIIFEEIPAALEGQELVPDQRSASFDIRADKRLRRHVDTHGEDQPAVPALFGLLARERERRWTAAEALRCLRAGDDWRRVCSSIASQLGTGIQDVGGAGHGVGTVGWQAEHNVTLLGPQHLDRLAVHGEGLRGEKPPAFRGMPSCWVRAAQAGRADGHRQLVV